MAKNTMLIVLVVAIAVIIAAAYLLGTSQPQHATTTPTKSIATAIQVPPNLTSNGNLNQSVNDLNALPQ